MALVCTRITEWIEEKISKPVTEWVERQEKKCKKRKWYDPRRWLCWLVTNLVKVVRWIVINVVKMVVTIVCRLIGRILRIIADLLEFLYLLFKALFTWDLCTLQEALGKLADALANVLTLIGHVLIDPFVDAINRYRLRRHVADEIDRRFADQPDTIAALKDAFHVDHGVFGLRATIDVHRMFVDSRTTIDGADVPNLIALHRSGAIDLFELAGFTTPCKMFSGKGWYRPRHQTAKFPFASGGGGFGEPIPPELSVDELREYLDSDGARGPHFLIYAIHPRKLGTRLDTAADEARRLGLIFEFERKEIGVVDPDHINYTRGIQPRFLIDVLGRHDATVDPEAARMELCKPVAVAVFGFTDRRTRGQTTVLFQTDCTAHNLPAQNTSGVSFIDDIPDQLRRYVLVHELGHYFGLCHVDGFQHIMVSGAEGQGDAFTGWSIPSSFVHGGPRFTFDEAKRAWNYILDHFPLDCLLGRAPTGPAIVIS